MIQKSLTEGSAPDSQGAGTGRAGGEGRMELREGLTSCGGGGWEDPERAQGQVGSGPKLKVGKARPIKTLGMHSRLLNWDLQGQLCVLPRLL